MTRLQDLLKAAQAARSAQVKTAEEVTGFRMALREYLKNFSYAELVRRSGYSRQHIADVRYGRRGVTEGFLRKILEGDTKG